ncbi:Crp/Fnr family transcriptional regulator, partial [Aureimonas pseudogalii]
FDIVVLIGGCLCLIGYATCPVKTGCAPTADLALLDRLSWQISTIAPRSEFVVEGDEPSRCCLVIEGMVASWNYTQSGDRQIQSVYIPGDMPDLMSLHLKRMDHFIGSISGCRVAYVSHDDVRHVCHASPAMNGALWRETLIDAALYRTAIIRNGQLNATQRLAHFVCELFQRFTGVGLIEENQFPFPLSQELTGQVLGLTNVSINRAFQALRSQELLLTTNGQIEVLNSRGLSRVGQFDAHYLHFRD